MVVHIDPTILEFYRQGNEDERLSSPLRHSGPLEFARTQELILRHLPEGAQRILDVGGGPGAYSQWLMGLGHDVTLIDPVDLHIAQATAKGVPAELGDARALATDAASVDVVLLLGPLYHLRERADRLQAWAEARRVLREGGLVFAGAISRFAAFLDLVVRLDRLEEESVFLTVQESLASGHFGDGSNGLFTTSYLHRPVEFRAEAEKTGFKAVEMFNIEGPGFLVGDFAQRWADPSRREALLAAARMIERDEDMFAAASHLFVVGRK